MEYLDLFLWFVCSLTLAMEKAEDRRVSAGTRRVIKIDGNWKMQIVQPVRTQMLGNVVAWSVFGLTKVDEATLRIVTAAEQGWRRCKRSLINLL